MDRIGLSVESAEQLTRAIHRVYDQVERYSKGQFDAIMKSVFGVPLGCGADG